MKRPIEWHKGNLKNQRINYQNARELFEREKLRLWEWDRKIRFAQFQIDEAIKLNKTEFNEDRFRVSK